MTERHRRVIHVATTYGVTSETFVVDAVQAAEEVGWTAWVATLNVQNRDRFPIPPDDRLLIPSFSVVRRALDRARGTSYPDRFAEALADKAASIGARVIHAHFGWSALYALPLAKATGLPLVCTFHASDVTVFPEPTTASAPVSPTYAELFDYLAEAIAVSGFTADALANLGWRGRTEIVPAGIRIDRFPLRRGIPEMRPARIVFVGRLVERKGLDVLLHALAELRSKGVDAELTVIGGGGERRAYEELSSQLELDAHVDFAGSRDSHEIADALAASHVFVMPSRSMPSGEVEGSPVVLKEALAVGVPVVATRTGGTAEVLPASVRNELVPGDDASALAAQIGRVLRSPGSWEQRARVGREWVEAQFDWRTLAARTALVYERVSAVRERKA